jgi:two-component system NtrC family response regulator
MTQKIKLLVVDDEVKFLNSLAKRLELRGFEVTQAENGQDALDRAKESEFDLAMIDLKMPGVGGKQVLEVLKKTNDFIEVIIMTGHGSADAAAECMEAGAFSYMPKPYELEKIMETLKQAYASRLKKKHRADLELVKRIQELERLSNPIEAVKAMSALVD